jgi:hypothetical protein
MEVSRVDSAIDHAVSEIAKTDAAIEQIREEYLQLVVAGPQDQAGFKSAETALKKVVRIRTSVEKTRKALKADSVRYGKAVDGEAKRVREAIEPIEEHLKTQCDVVRLEEARQKVAAENARRDEVNGWVAELSELGWPVDLPALQRMTAEEFGFLRLSAKKRHAEQAEEREAIAKERAALEAERLELEELRAEKAQREAATIKESLQVENSGNLVDIRTSETVTYVVDVPKTPTTKREQIDELLDSICDTVVFCDYLPEDEILQILNQCVDALAEVTKR